MTTKAAGARRVYDLGPIGTISLGEGRTFRAGPAVIAVFRTRDGKLLAAQAACPHKGGPLADGIVGGGKVVCPLHGYSFDLATGEPVGNACPALKTYAVTVDESGEILLALDDVCQEAGARPG
ncbi:MAG: Rieske 2Fe-2S domain-containing protein [Chloroflexi bacterium]|nr:Rieske 2Fe-2S domain-containing protein [Chloroflexota bacterium]